MHLPNRLLTSFPSSLFFRSNPVFRSDSEMIGKVNSFRAWVASAETMAEQYSGPPTPIDFAAVKEKVRAKDLVDNIEKFYATAQPPAEIYVWDEADKAEKTKLVEEAKVDREKVLSDIAFYKERLAILKTNRTTRETTAADLRQLYPDIAKEIDEEIDNREWFEDVVDACRSAPDTSKYRNFLKERYPDQAALIDQQFDLATPGK